MSVARSNRLRIRDRLWLIVSGLTRRDAKNGRGALARAPYTGGFKGGFA